MLMSSSDETENASFQGVSYRSESSAGGAEVASEMYNQAKQTFEFMSGDTV